MSSGSGLRLAWAAFTASAISRTESGSGTLIGSARWAMSSSARGRRNSRRSAPSGLTRNLRPVRVARVRDKRQRGQPQRQQPPQMQADIGNVVAAGTVFGRPHLGGVGEGCECAALMEAAGEVAQVRRRRRVQPHMVHILGGREPLEKFDRAGRPAGDVAGQLPRASPRCPCGGDSRSCRPTSARGEREVGGERRGAAGSRSGRRYRAPPNRRRSR